MVVELASRTNPLGQTLRYIHVLRKCTTYVDHPPFLPPAAITARGKEGCFNRINETDSTPSRETIIVPATTPAEAVNPRIPIVITTPTQTVRIIPSPCIVEKEKQNKERKI